jgi:penicillin-binding protein 1B
VYEPGNYGDHYSMREVPLREGLVKSLNVVTVRIAQKITIPELQETAVRLGLPKPPPYPATALGTTEATPLQVASAYTAFANLGKRVSPTGLKRVTNGTGTTIRALNPMVYPALAPQVAYILTDFMKDVINRGTAAGARARGFTSIAAGKTGTSRDGWFAGYTPNLVCVVYVGFDDNSQLGLEGAKSALPIWADFMKAAVRLRPELGGDEFPKPNTGITEAEIDPETGGLATPSCGNRRKELFITGTEPTIPCPLHDTGTGDIVSAPTPGEDYSVPPFKEGRPAPESPDVEPPRAPPPPAVRKRRVIPLPDQGALRSERRRPLVSEIRPRRSMPGMFLTSGRSGLTQ